MATPKMGGYYNMEWHLVIYSSGMATPKMGGYYNIRESYEITVISATIDFSGYYSRIDSPSAPEFENHQGPHVFTGEEQRQGNVARFNHVTEDTIR